MLSQEVRMPSLEAYSVAQTWCVLMSKVITCALAVNMGLVILQASSLVVVTVNDLQATQGSQSLP